MRINLKVKVKNVDFTIACESEEEEKIKKLINSIDRRLALLTDSFPHTNLMTLFLVNSIMMEDEISDLKIQIKESESSPKEQKSNENTEKDFTDIKDYIENIIEKINKA